MALLNREAIFAAADLPQERIAVPEWGGEVIVTQLNGLARAELDDIQRELFATVPGEETTKKITNVDYLRFVLELLVRALVDEHGDRVFTQASDIERLNTKNPQVIGMLGQSALRLNGLGVTEQETIKKNSEPLPNGASISSSLAVSAAP